MAKNADALVLAAANLLATGVEMYFCAGQPVSRADAITRKAGPAITLGAGDFTVAGPTSGVCTVTIAAKSETATVAETVDHIAICTGSSLLFVDTVATAQSSNVGATIGAGAITVTIGPVS